MPDKITSVSNPRIRRLVELRKKAKLRRETGLFVIEGGRLCADTPEEFISEVYVTEEWMKNAPEKETAGFRNRPYTVVTEEVMAKAADTATPQGILCAARMPSTSFEEMIRKELLLWSWRIFRIRNLGTIFRTAEAAGLRDPDEPRDRGPLQSQSRACDNERCLPDALCGQG